MLDGRIRKTVRVKRSRQEGPDGTIRAQVGHISAQIMKRYSHIRRQELNRAAAALEPKCLKNVLVIAPEAADGATVQ